MPFQQPPRMSSALAGGLAAGLMVTVASCGHITPLGPGAGPGPKPVAAPPVAMPVRPQALGSPIIVQVMRRQPPAARGGCQAGWVTVFLPRGAAPTGCYRPVGPPATISSASVSSVFTYPPSPPGQPKVPAQYGLMVAVPAADVSAVTAVITRAADSGDALGISVAGKLWQAPQVHKPFQIPGRMLQIALLSRDQALQLYRILVPSG